MAVAKEPQQQQGFDNAKMYVWVKGLETKVNNLIREVNIIKNDFIQKSSKMKKEVGSLGEDLREMKHEQGKFVQKMDLIIKELKMTAGREEVTTLKKYIDFWNPINFVTQRDLERMVERKLKEVEKSKTNKGVETNKTDKINN